MIGWLEKNRIVPLIIAFLISVEIYYFSSLNGSSNAVSNIWISRAYHLTVFFLLGFFVLSSIKGRVPLKSSDIILASAISIAYSIIDEIHQMFVPLRYAGLEDVLTDTLGIFSSIILYSYISLKREKK